MKIVIDAQGVKREIEGPYSICASAPDLRRLRDAIAGFLVREDQVYGWVEIVEKPVHAPDSKPKPWVP